VIALGNLATIGAARTRRAVHVGLVALVCVPSFIQFRLDGVFAQGEGWLVVPPVYASSSGWGVRRSTTIAIQGLLVGGNLALVWAFRAAQDEAEATAAIRAREGEGPRTPIIALTGVVSFASLGVIG
jgi:hypothetical protein